MTAGETLGILRMGRSESGVLVPVLRSFPRTVDGG